ncbi:MAG: glycine oxidase ThiO [Myxococcales bacterium]|nr:glycine oxidase ThiO [Myxococcales bacterium]
MAEPFANPDVVIVGGGVIGATVGWRLQEAGLSTLIVDRDGQIPKASWAAAGMLCPVSEAHFTERELLDLGLQSAKMYPEFAAELEAASGASIDYTSDGTTLVAMDADEVRALRRLFAFQKECGLPVSWESADALHERLPMLSHLAVAGVFAPQDHRVDARKLLDAARSAFVAAGGRWLSDDCNTVRIHAGRVVGCDIGDHRIDCSTLIVAGGAWSGRLAGLPKELVPPIRPVKGQMLAIGMDPNAPLIDSTIRGRRAYLVPRPGGRLVVGATSEEKGLDDRITAGGMYDLLRGAYELLPGTYELPLLETWCGFRPGTPDNLPILGPCEVEGLVFATGHYRNGILLTPVTASAIARTVLDGAAPEVLAPFSISRFQTRA